MVATAKILPAVSLTIVFVTIGMAAVGASSPWLVLLASAAVVLLSTTVLLFGMRSLPIWQGLASAGLAGYVVLNYGFANLTVPGTGIPVGHVLMIAALLILIAQSDMRGIRGFFQEPAARWWLLLVGLSVLHLLVDIRQYGAWALRDASFVFEGVFLLLGFLWSMRAPNLGAVIAALGVLFVLNAAYSLTLPMATVLAEHSPVSGIFQPVPLLGFYTHTPLFLAAGAFFFLLVVTYPGWSGVIILSLALFQFGWSLVFQSRTVYLGILAVLFSMALLGRVRQGAKLASLLGAGVVIFFVLIETSGFQIHGRIGQVNSEFLRRHFSSVFLVPGTPAVGSAQWRLDLLPELQARWTASGARMVFGEGFGQPLIDFRDAGPLANVVRHPHNTHLSVLLRLGMTGFLVWLLVQWALLRALLRSVQTPRQNRTAHALSLWLFAYYVLAIVGTTFEPELEFSYGAIPFFTLMGFALGLARTEGLPAVADGEDGKETRSRILSLRSGPPRFPVMASRS